MTYCLSRYYVPLTLPELDGKDLIQYLRMKVDHGDCDVCKYCNGTGIFYFTNPSGHKFHEDCGYCGGWGVVQILHPQRIW